MKNNKGDETTVRWGTLLKTLFLAPGTLRIGMENDATEKRFVVVRCSPDGGGIPLVRGEVIPFWLRLMMPILVVTDAGELPVYMVSDAIGEDDPDEWIDRNEERCLPPGFAADKVVTDYAVANGRIVAISAVAETRNEHMAKLESMCGLSRVNPPLQGVAQLLNNEENSRCIIWKLSRNGSLFSRVEGGVVTDTCTCWISAGDIADGDTETFTQTGRIVNSIAEGWNDFPVVFLAPEAVATVHEGMVIGNGNIRWCTKPDTLPLQYAEAFGNAITPDSYAQLVPFHKKQNTRKLHAAWCNGMSAVKSVVLFLLIVLGIFGSYTGLTAFLINRDSAAMEGIKEQHDTVERTTASRDTLLMKLKKQTLFVRGESRLTKLLNDLQRAIPEGAGLEELNVTEVKEDTWAVILHVRAQSSTVMQPFLDGVGTVRGMSDVRMVYSERGEDSAGKRMLLFKVEGQWR